MKYDKNFLEELKQAPPLEAAKLLQDMELYDAKSSQEIIDEVYEQFANGENIKDEILKPVFLSVIDGLLEATAGGRAARKKGLTASRVLNECEEFSYEGNTSNNTSVNGFTEYKNANHTQLEYAVAINQWEKSGKVGEIPKYEGTVNSNFNQKYNKETRAKSYEDKRAMDGYKHRKTIGHSTVSDEYRGETDLYDAKKNRPINSNDEKHGKLAETDHIVPLKQIHEEFKHNYALDDNDIKMLANADYNFAMTAAEINDARGKKDLSNKEYIEKMKKAGTPLDKQTEENMLRLQKEAENRIEKEANSLILHNIVGKVDQNKIDTKYDNMLESKQKEYEKKHGVLPTEEKLQKMKEKVGEQKEAEIAQYKLQQKDKAKEIAGNNVKYARNQATDYAIGNLFLFIVKPIYFEIKDIFSNGLQEGVGADSGVQALTLRFSRIKKYVLSNAKGFLGDNAWDFVKAFVSSLIEGIISLFVGIFKQILKIIKEGIKVFTQSIKMLFGEEAKNMSQAEKGDAIIKLLGGSIIAIAGIGIEALINKVGIGEPWSVVLATMLSGIASALFMYILDKADIFSVKAEKRRDRIIEIFNERINDIKEAEKEVDTYRFEILKKQREEFETINERIEEGFKNNNIDTINAGLNDVARFFKIDLEYKSIKEFQESWDSGKPIEL